MSDLFLLFLQLNEILSFLISQVSCFSFLLQTFPQVCHIILTSEPQSQKLKHVTQKVGKQTHRLWENLEHIRHLEI